ncbi:MAG: hypothetical protein LBQ05_02805, partial [Christensenellaceae bacterium]|nr:hypothetical protein [Christensenellaceae bacterium]
MIDINLIREKPDWVKQQLLKRMDSVDFDEVLKLETLRRELLQ